MNQLETSISSKLKPTIWPRDAGQLMPCQLTITWMSNIKYISYKTLFHIATKLLQDVVVVFSRPVVVVLSCLVLSFLPLLIFTSTQYLQGTSDRYKSRC